MSLKIVRNDITKMNTQAIVDVANVDRESVAFITPGSDRKAEYIIHTMSPDHMGGDEGEEKLRSCYRKSLLLAKEKGVHSIAFPLIPSGGFGYPKEEGMRIAVDEISAFLSENDMEIVLVVNDDGPRYPGRRISRDLEAYIDRNYVEGSLWEEYDGVFSDEPRRSADSNRRAAFDRSAGGVKLSRSSMEPSHSPSANFSCMSSAAPSPMPPASKRVESKAFGLGSVFKKKRASKDQRAMEPEKRSFSECVSEEAAFSDFEAVHESKLKERMRHISDTFSQYLMYLIQDKNMENADVYKRAIVDKKIFSKIKNNADYHPQKITALCLCVGAKLNLDETKDLLARAGYALSPCDKTDIIFSYFIENEIYDMIELDIQLEEHGLPCIIA